MNLRLAGISAAVEAPESALELQSCLHNCESAQLRAYIGSIL